MAETRGGPELETLLAEVAAGRLSAAAAIEQLVRVPTEDLGFARLDHDRLTRLAMPEVVYGEGKTADQIAVIVGRLRARGHPVLVTRLTAAQWSSCREALEAGPGRGDYDALSRTWRWFPVRWPEPSGPPLLVVSAGTSDLPVAEEAARTAEVLGHRVERLADVGVAGIHRLLAQHAALRRAAVVIVVAGMEGALPSVVAGLVSRPVVAVPTSVGYGASFEGLAALLAMLNSCAPGVSVVNIDNGFGAACAAARLLGVLREGAGGEGSAP